MMTALVRPSQIVALKSGSELDFMLKFDHLKEFKNYFP